MERLNRQITLAALAALVLMVSGAIYVFYHLAIVRTLVQLWQDATSSRDEFREAWLTKKSL